MQRLDLRQQQKKSNKKNRRLIDSSKRLQIPLTKLNLIHSKHDN